MDALNRFTTHETSALFAMVPAPAADGYLGQGLLEPGSASTASTAPTASTATATTPASASTSTSPTPAAANLPPSIGDGATGRARVR